MRRISFIVICVCAVMSLAACREDGQAGNGNGVMMASDRAMTASQAAPSDMALNREQFGTRRIAEDHDLLIETDAEDLKQRYDRDFKECLVMGCEIVGSNIQDRNTAHIHARISPEKLGPYLDFLGQGIGELKSHGVRADDKTLEYIDTEAKIKSKEALRARLLKLMDEKPGANIEEILAVECELNRVEQELDSAKGALQHLQTITGKATVRVNYLVPFYAQDIDVHYGDLSRSLKQSWKGLLDNLSAVIIFIGASLPWVPVIFAGIWVVVRAFRFAFGKGVSLLFWRKKKKEEPQS